MAVSAMTGWTESAKPAPSAVTRKLRRFMGGVSGTMLWYSAISVSLTTMNRGFRHPEGFRERSQSSIPDTHQLKEASHGNRHAYQV
jgi:hypothetical protein